MKAKTKKTKQEQGFTLIELLVVISIIGLLSSFILVSLNSARVKARDSRRVADLRSIQNALELYYNETNTYPQETDSDLAINWGNMLKDLADHNLISLNSNENQLTSFADFLIKKAHAVVAEGPARESPQDPIYPLRSYGYMANADYSSYRLRAQLENADNPILNNGISGQFIGSTITGSAACDKSLGMYCIGATRY